MLCPLSLMLRPRLQGKRQRCEVKMKQWWMQLWRPGWAPWIGRRPGLMSPLPCASWPRIAASCCIRCSPMPLLVSSGAPLTSRHAFSTTCPVASLALLLQYFPHPPSAFCTPPPTGPFKGGSVCSAGFQRMRQICISVSSDMCCVRKFRKVSVKGQGGMMNNM